MVFITKRTINGKEKTYLEHSIKLPDGTVKKISKYLLNYKNEDVKKLAKQYSSYFKEKGERIRINFAVRNYDKNTIFTEEQIRKIEYIKLKYKELIRNITINQLEDILDRFTVNFTYESNAIEGNSLTLKDVTIIIKENVSIKGKDLREIHETINTRKTNELVFNNKFKINKEDIIKLHTMLVENTRVSTGYKKFPNVLLMRHTKTTPPEKVEEEMKELIDWYTQEETLHPLMKAAIFHGRFEKIHPFEDGNGRTGRMLINVILISNGYPPLIIRKSQRISYFHALEASDARHIGNLERFLLERYKNTYKKFFEVYVKYL